MKIYFAGSIRGGHQDAGFYQQIIQYLSRFGTVLTEHLWDGNANKTAEKVLSDEEIFKRDVHWIEAADILVAEVSSPSLGVGFEIAWAEKNNKQILCLYFSDAQKPLSAMISGNPNLNIQKYNSIEAARKCIDVFFNQVF